MRFLRLLTVLIASVCLSACGFTGINSVPLPFTSGSDKFEITVYMENAVNLVPNSEVKIDEVTVGSVRKIEFVDWTAKLTVALNEDVTLPENAVARIGQKSLLGAEYLELAPPEAAASELPLRPGAVIDTVSTSRYPETEEVLASLSLVLNGGGLSQIKTISTEFNAALSGREDDIRSLLTQLDTFVRTLDVQRADIIIALEQLDRLAEVYANDTGKIDEALAIIPLGVNTLAAERESLTQTLNAISEFGDVTHNILTQAQDDLVANVENLTPIFRELADAGDRLTYSLGSISFPFPLDAVEAGFRGDYINFFATIDASAAAISRDYLGGTPLDGLYTALMGLVYEGPAVEALDPLLGPVADLLPDPLAVPPQDVLGLIEGLIAPSGSPAAEQGAAQAPASGNVLTDLLNLLGGVN